MKRNVVMVFAVAAICFGLLVSCGSELLAGETWITGLGAVPVNGKHPVYQSVVFLGEEISAATGGKYDIEIYHSSQLGGEREILEGVHLGTYKFGVITSSYVSAYSDAMKIFELPYLFKDYDHFLRVLRSDLAKEMLATLEEHNLVGLGFAVSGVYGVSNGRRPVVKLEDMKGLKIRAMDAPIQLECLNLLGGLGVPMAFGEIYTGLQQNTIDGVLAINSGFYALRLYEVNKYLTLLNMFVLPSPVMVNKEYWDSLSAEDQANIRAGVAKALERHYVDFLEQDQEALDGCAANGMEIVTDYDRPAFEKAVEPVYAKYQGEYGDWIKRIKDMADQ